MNTFTVSQPPTLGKPFELHVPSFSAMRCVQCEAPITDLEAWLAMECPGEPAAERRAA